MSRIQDILQILSQNNGLTASEVCFKLGLPREESGAVGINLIRMSRRQQILEAQKRYCSVTGKKAKTYEALPSQKQAQKQPTQKAKPTRAPRKSAQQKAAEEAARIAAEEAKRQAEEAAKKAAEEAARLAAEAAKSKLTPQQQAAAERRRRIIEEEMKKRQQKSALLAEIERVKLAKREFQALTGYVGADLAQAKTAYRQAARKHHPDCGGNSNIFMKLADAWKIVQKELEIKQ